MDLGQTLQERLIAIGWTGAGGIRLGIPLALGAVFGSERLTPGGL